MKKWTSFFCIYALVFGTVAFATVSAQAQYRTSILGPAKYERIKTTLNDIAKQYSAIARMVNVGPSDSGETIWGIEIGTGSVHHLVVATHHGNEYGSTEVALNFAKFVAKTPMAGITVFIIPVLNIEGYNNGDRYESAGHGSYDPNRDYPGPCGTEGPHHLKSTAALARFVEDHQIVASATLHTYWPAVVYPWGFATKDLSTPYDKEFIDMVKWATQESKYTIGNGTEVIYPAAGTFEDYAFWKNGIWSLLFELGFSHSPSNSQIDQMILLNNPGLYRFLQNAPKARAVDHEFHGKCDASLLAFDRHDE